MRGTGPPHEVRLSRSDRHFRRSGSHLIAPPLPLGSGVSPAIFGYFPLLESNKHKTAHATTGADNRNVRPVKTARRASKPRRASPAIFGTFPLLESNKQKPAHATARADNRKIISLEVRGFPPAGFATFARTKVEKGWLGYKA